MAKKQKAKSGMVSMDELVQMKSMQLMGKSKSAIARDMRRNIKTVGNALTAFEALLPQDAGIQADILENVEEMKRQMMSNAKRIIYSADAQVAAKIGNEDTSAIDAAKISDIYFRRAGVLAGFAKNGLGGDEDSDSPKVQKIINQVFNINVTNNDHLRADARDRQGDAGSHDGGEAAAATRAMQERSVLPG